MTRPRRVVAIIGLELDALAPGVEICKDDRCDEPGIHAVHPVSRRGKVPRTRTCTICFRNVLTGALCACEET